MRFSRWRATSKAEARRAGPERTLPPRPRRGDRVVEAHVGARGRRAQRGEVVAIVGRDHLLASQRTAIPAPRENSSSGSCPRRRGVVAGEADVRVSRARGRHRRPDRRRSQRGRRGTRPLDGVLCECRSAPPSNAWAVAMDVGDDCDLHSMPGRPARGGRHRLSQCRSRGGRGGAWSRSCWPASAPTHSVSVDAGRRPIRNCGSARLAAALCAREAAVSCALRPARRRAAATCVDAREHFDSAEMGVRRCLLRPRTAGALAAWAPRRRRRCSLGLRGGVTAGRGGVPNSAPAGGSGRRGAALALSGPLALASLPPGAPDGAVGRCAPAWRRSPARGLGGRTWFRSAGARRPPYRRRERRRCGAAYAVSGAPAGGPSRGGRERRRGVVINARRPRLL